MYHLQHDFPLKSNNTFGISANAKHYLTVNSPDDLIRFFEENNPEKNEKRLFLGAGSNLLFIHNFDGIVIHPEIDGIHLISENPDIAVVEAGAGVVWDQFVEWCVERGFGGVENLSLIPGNVGAVPVQNIGAYGTEAESVIAEVKGIDLDTLEIKSFSHSECQFGYRTSLFKVELKERFIVTSVIFHLTKQTEFQLEYGALKAEVCKLGEINLRTSGKRLFPSANQNFPILRRLEMPEVFSKIPSFGTNRHRSEKILSRLACLSCRSRSCKAGSRMVDRKSRLERTISWKCGSS